MALPLNAVRLARQVWHTEEQAFVAGASWVPVSQGQAVLHPEIPEVWDASFVGRLPPEVDARRLVSDTRRLLLDAGCGHVKIVVEDPRGFATVGRELRRLGLGERAYVTMLIRRMPTTRAGRAPVVVRAVRTRQDRAWMAEVRGAVRREAPWFAPEVSGALDAWEDLQAATLDLTWLVAWLDGEPAGAAGLLMTEDGASLQSIATVPSLRRQGVASALVREVVRRAFARGAPWVSLLTDRDDHPRWLYRKLGFREVGEVREYLRAIV